MTQALIFDLDNCLASSREPGEELFAPAFAAIRQANRGTVADADLDKALDELWRHALDHVAEKYGFSQEMLRAGWEVFRHLEVPGPMQGYGDLEVLSQLPGQRFLVTSGFRRLQESKIRALNLLPLLTAAHVDAIDEPDRLGKEGFFRKILEGHRLRPEEVLVVGDSAESEIAVGRRLGMRTVQTLRPGVPRAEEADFHIGSLAELKELLDYPAGP